MAKIAAENAVYFLFRSDAGEIDAKTWGIWTAVLGALLAVLTAIWIRLSPNAQHDLNATPFFAIWTLLTYVYLLLYAFCVLLIAISHYNLSAKRWRARGWPPALAGLLPLLVLLDGTAHWLQPRVPEDIYPWHVTAIDFVLLGVVLWNLVELGLRPFKQNI